MALILSVAGLFEMFDPVPEKHSKNQAVRQLDFYWDKINDGLSGSNICANVDLEILCETLAVLDITAVAFPSNFH